MSELVTTELMLFLYAIRFGVWMAFLYDILRIFRRVVGHNSLALAVEDFLYWLAVGVRMFLILYQYNNGRLRFYIILGAAIGILLYTSSISIIFVGFCSALIKKTKRKACQAAEKAAGRVKSKTEKILERPVRVLAAKGYAFRKIIGGKLKHLGRYLKKKLTLFIKMIKLILCKQ